MPGRCVLLTAQALGAAVATFDDRAFPDPLIDLDNAATAPATTAAVRTPVTTCRRGSCQERTVRRSEGPDTRLPVASVTAQPHLCS